MHTNQLPLVSVAVVTYNSSATVLETLDSIRIQTYPNIELIVSDDCSIDNTVEICRGWIEQNKERFNRTKVVSVTQNTGVSANCNRAENACLGEWIKVIAGDDLLMPNCIEDCMRYVSAHPETIYLFGRCKAFGVSQERCKEIDEYFDYSFFNKTQDEQLHRLIMEGNCLPAAAVFYNSERAKSTGVTNDERIPLLEDLPKWINLLKAGVRFEFIDKVIVNYRVSENSLSTGSRSKAFDLSGALYYKLYVFRYEYEHGCKKIAIEKWLRAQYKIRQNMLWYILFKSYKLLIMNKLH